jgi:hypothetical protein
MPTRTLAFPGRERTRPRGWRVSRQSVSGASRAGWRMKKRPWPDGSGSRLPQSTGLLGCYARTNERATSSSLRTSQVGVLIEANLLKVLVFSPPDRRSFPPPFLSVQIAQHPQPSRPIRRGKNPRVADSGLASPSESISLGTMAIHLSNPKRVSFAHQAPTQYQQIPCSHPTQCSHRPRLPVEPWAPSTWSFSLSP